VPAITAPAVRRARLDSIRQSHSRDQHQAADSQCALVAQRRDRDLAHQRGFEQQADHRAGDGVIVLDELGLQGGGDDGEEVPVHGIARAACDCGAGKHHPGGLGNAQARARVEPAVQAGGCFGQAHQQHDPDGDQGEVGGVGGAQRTRQVLRCQTCQQCTDADAANVSGSGQQRRPAAACLGSQIDYVGGRRSGEESG
jgi:hypothetical protein